MVRCPKCRRIHEVRGHYVADMVGKIKKCVGCGTKFRLV
jgi:hypothetical protein